MYACIHIPGPTSGVDLLAVANHFAPQVEVLGTGTVVFSLAGLRQLMGGPHTIASEIARRAHERRLDGRIGVAQTPDLAVLAAQTRPGATIILPGEELRYLGTLALRTLPLSEEALAVLELWGVKTLEEFCALPESGLSERLGLEAALLRKLVRGEWHRPLRIGRMGEPFEDVVPLEYPLEDLQPLLFLINRSLQQFCERMKTESLAAAEVVLSLLPPFELRLQLPVPSRDSKTLLRLLQLNLEATPPKAAVTSMRIAVVPIQPRQVQHDLYTLPAPEPEKLELTLQKIRGFVGADRVGSPELLNTHRPDAWVLQRLPNLDGKKASADRPQVTAKLAFRYYRPPREAQVELRADRPRVVRSRGVAGRVMECSGPWIRSGDWWNTQSWSRREWDVGLDSGGLYRIYQTTLSWFVEGSYD